MKSRRAVLTLPFQSVMFSLIALIFVGLVLDLPSPVRASAPPPDLRLEWMEPTGPTREGQPIRGEAGEIRRLDYRIRNVGGSNAFAVILSVNTALGPFGRPVRIQPGPKPGRDLRRSLDLPLAEGMREVCIEARLQTLEAEDPQDPNAHDNQLCRVVEVQAQKEHTHDNQ